ncbi:DNA glycosylase [Xylaria palmicola]|nr:DNA glycosylase [Xylaria palmicola]
MRRRSLRQAQQRGYEALDATSNKHLKPDEDAASNKHLKPDEDDASTPISHPTSRKRTARQTRSDASHSEDGDFQSSDGEVSKKKRKVVPRRKSGQKSKNHEVIQRLFGADRAASEMPPCQLPQRTHNIHYHRPLLLDSRKGRAALLEWFDSVSTSRSMPWRKPWIDPQTAEDSALLRQKLERRAYEVWISEIMLQQTRVAVVIDYWNRWMGKWQSIQELAAADHEDVLAAWRGLGYYSRATRILDAAKLVCQDSTMNGLLPSSVDELVAKVPGVGRYTAGAVSAIVFGKAAPMVDGNVLRVLSRQLGLLGNVKSNKAVIDLLWAAADALVKAVAKDTDEEKTPSTAEEQISDRPGRWGQALMELGSTICAPKPDCEACPIRPTCRAYGEGYQLAFRKGLAPKDICTDLDRGAVLDIEDLCNFCESFDDINRDGGDDNDIDIVPITKKNPSRGTTRARPKKQVTLSAFFTQPGNSEDAGVSSPPTLAPAGLAVIVDHARKFPVKIAKKAVREEETLVCAIRRGDGRYVIRRRPQKGLLAGLWEFPSWTVPEDYENTATAYKRASELYASGILDPTLTSKFLTHPKLKYIGKLGSVPWLFSHLKLTMHVFLFELKCSNAELQTIPNIDARWSGSVEEESMGTGMRKCWELVRDANGD